MTPADRARAVSAHRLELKRERRAMSAWDIRRAAGEYNEQSPTNARRYGRRDIYEAALGRQRTARDEREAEIARDYDAMDPRPTPRRALSRRARRRYKNLGDLELKGLRRRTQRKPPTMPAVDAAGMSTAPWGSRRITGVGFGGARTGPSRGAIRRWQRLTGQRYKPPPRFG